MNLGGGAYLTSSCRLTDDFVALDATSDMITNECRLSLQGGCRSQLLPPTQEGGGRLVISPSQVQRITHQNPKQARSSPAKVCSRYEPIALCLNDHRKTLSPPPRLLRSNSVCDYLQHQSCRSIHRKKRLNSQRALQTQLPVR